MKNDFMTRIENKNRELMTLQRAFTIQQCIDIACITLAELGCGEVRVKRFVKTYKEIFTEWATMALDDDLSDHDLNYTKQKMDDRLRPLFGDTFEPWEQRYNMMVINEKKVTPVVHHHKKKKK